MKEFDSEAVRSLLKAAIKSAYVATGINQDCSYLLCNVTSGRRELRLMKLLDEREGGIRTRDALHRRRRTDPALGAQFETDVAEPNAVEAAAFATEARETLVRLGISSVVFDPAVLNVRQLAQDVGVDIAFERADYLEINGSILRDFAKRVFICPGSEFGRGLTREVAASRERGTPLLRLDGTKLTPTELDAMVAEAHQWMRQEGFSEEEIAAY